MPTAYDLSVFINCPFDTGYIPLFDVILFTIYKCGFRPRCASEVEDSGQVRIEKINKIIEECRCGIHDISKTELDVNNNLPRFNMPFELGLFLGAKRFGSKQQKLKVLIILDKERHSFHKYISDISGQDVKSHNNNPAKLIKCIRDALNSLGINDDPIPGADVIYDNYKKFKSSQPDLKKKLQLDRRNNSYADKVALVERWLKFMLFDKLKAHYILIKGGLFAYSLTERQETVSNLYMAKFTVTNRLYREFINYLLGKGAFASVLSPEIFRNKLLEFAKTIHGTGFYDFLQGDPNLAMRLCSAYDDDKRFNKSDQPVVGVSWYAAKAYCYWLSYLETDGMHSCLYRLPTAIEWEYTASGKDSRSYPWGDSVPTPKKANYKSTTDATTIAGRYPEGATPEGLYDMAGNVWEWMDNWRNEEEKVFLRGGSWDTTPDDLRCSAFDFQRPFYSSSEIGFRVVRYSEQQ